MTDNLANRDEELPVTGRRYPHEDPQGRYWSDIFKDALRELNAHTTVSGAPREEFDHVPRMVYVPMSEDDEPLSISDGSEWINLEELIDGSGGDGTLTAFDSGTELGDFSELEAGDDISGTVEDERLTLDSLADGDGGTAGASWDVLLREVEGETYDYEGIDEDGTVIVSTSDAADALQTAINETPEGGTLRVKGEYVFPDDADYIEQDKSLRVLGYGATLVSEHEDVGSALWYIDGEQTGTYEVIDIDYRTSGSPILQFDQAVDDVMSESDLLMLESDETRTIYGTEESWPIGCGHKIAFTATEEDEADDGTDFLDDLANDEVSLADQLEFDYDLSHTVEAIHFEPVTVDIRGFDIVGPDIWFPEVSGIELEGTTESRFQDIDFYNISHKCLEMNACYDDTVIDCNFSHGASNHDGGDGYGVAIRNGSAHNNVVRCDFTAMRHGLAHSSSSPGHVRRRTTIRDCDFRYHRSTALDMHDADIGHQVINCRFYGGRDDGADGCPRATFRGCYFHTPGHSGIHCAPDAPAEWYDVQVIDCEFVECDRAIRFARTPTAYGSISITGSRFEACSETIQIRQRVDSFVLNGCTFEECSDMQVEIATRGHWDDYDDFGVRSGEISGNSFRDISGACIRIYNDGEDTGDHPVVRDLSVDANNATGVDEFIRGDLGAAGLMVTNTQVVDASAFIDDESGRFDDWFVVSNRGRNVTEMFAGQWDDADHDTVDINSG